MPEIEYYRETWLTGAMHKNDLRVPEKNNYEYGD